MSISQAMLFFSPSMQSSKLSLDAGKEKESIVNGALFRISGHGCSDYMASFYSWKKKKKEEQSLSVSIIPFDLSIHTFFFYLRVLMLTLAAVLWLSLSVVSITALQALVLRVPSRAAECNHCELFKEGACSFLRLSKCVTKLTITAQQRACLFRSWYEKNSSQSRERKPSRRCEARIGCICVAGLDESECGMSPLWFVLKENTNRQGKQAQLTQIRMSCCSPAEKKLPYVISCSHIWKTPSLCRLQFIWTSES